MVEFETNDKLHQIVLEPNRSMSWENNKKILIAIFVVNFVIASAWTYMGAWLVLPFAGLEVLVVGIGMYYVCWKLNFKQIITVEAESFILQKGVYFPKEQWQWQTSNTVLLKRPSNYRMSPPTLFLKHLNERIEIGDFLNRVDKKKLLEHCQTIGIAVQTIQ